MKTLRLGVPLVTALALVACGGGNNTGTDSSADSARDGGSTDVDTSRDAAFDSTTAIDGSTGDDVQSGTDVVTGTDVGTSTDVVTGTDSGPRTDAGTPTNDTLFGAAFNPTDNAHFDQINAAFGAIRVRRTFDGNSGTSPYLNRIQAQDIARNAASAYSFKYPPAEVVAGMHDADFRSFFQGIADDHTVFWTYWHEPDDELYVDHTFTPAQYRAAWAHIRTIADQVRATRPRLRIYATLIIMEYSMRPNIAMNRPLLGANGMYPGDDVIEVFGVDSYNSGADGGSVRDVEIEFGKVIDFAQAHGKPWAIGEIGSCPVVGSANGRADFLRNAIRYWISRNYPPMYVSYFDLDWPSCDYRLESDPPALSVWHDAVTRGLSAF